MDNWLRCTVTAGQFHQEFGVDGEQFNGKVFSLFVPEETVRFVEPPTKDRTSPGWVKVHVVERKDNMVLVRLPRETFQSGYYVTVRPDQLDKEARASRQKTSSQR